MRRFYQNRKPFSRTSWFFIAMIVIGTACFVAFRLLGSTVDPADATLNEPFFLLGLGYILTGIGILGLAIRLLVSLIRDSRGEDGNG